MKLAVMTIRCDVCGVLSSAVVFSGEGKSACVQHESYCAFLAACVDGPDAAAKYVAEHGYPITVRGVA